MPSRKQRFSGSKAAIARRPLNVVSATWNTWNICKRPSNKSSKSLNGFVLCAFLIWSGIALGQIRSGVITGRVIDLSEAPVAGAQVTVAAPETNAQFHVVTNIGGEYMVPYLPAGQYSVRVAATGFATSQITGINLGTAATVRADVKLELATVGSAVTVTASAGELQTESATVQNAVGEKLIESVPNIIHNPFYYATLQAGVVPRAAFNNTQGVRSFGIGTDARRQYSAISANGGLAFSNDILLDGVSVQGPTWNEATVIPNSEGIQEVRTLVNNYSAEFGRGQGIVTLTSKSGTNQYHSSLFYRLRNEALNANTFSNNARGIARAPFKVNSYGATLGGPVRKDKLFFFVSYEGLRNHQVADYLGTVPTALERAGNFSQTLVNVNGRPASLQVFDPFAVVQTQPNVYQRDPIPNAIISNPNPLASKMFSFYPTPNRRPDDVYNSNNYFLRGTQTFSRNSVNGRLDYRWRNQSLYATGGVFQGSVNTPPFWGPGALPFHYGLQVYAGGYGTNLTDKNPYGSIGDTVVLSPTLVLDIRYGISRTQSINLMPSTDNFNYDQFGIPKDLLAINPAPGHPPVSVFGGSWTPLQNETPNQTQFGTNHHLVGSVTKSVRRWTFKAGAEYRVYLSNYYSAKGTVYFGGGAGTAGSGGQNDYTRQLVTATGVGIGAVPANLAGFGPASLLLGAGALGVNLGSGLTHSTFAHKYVAFYSQNDWRATSRLTVNLGLRWDVQRGITDRYNKFCAFDPAGTTFNTPGAYVCPGVNGNSRNLWQSSLRDFGPRGGLAYRVSDTFVVRAGYGLTYLPTNTGYRNTPFNMGMDQFSPYTDSRPYGLNPAGVPIGPFNSALVNKIIPATGSDTSLRQIYGGIVTQRFLVNGYPDQNTQQWNLFLEKRLGSAWVTSAGYSASRGSHLTVARIPLSSAQSIPQSVANTWRQGYIASNGRSDPGLQLIPNPLQPAGGPLFPYQGPQAAALVTQAQSLLPYPLFTGVQYQAPVGWSNYHSLVLQANRRFANGLLINAHYTWSKSLDFSQSENFTGSDFSDSGSSKAADLRNFRNDYSPSYFDVPHRLVISYLYELPFGSGKRFGSESRLLKAVVSGWRTGAVAVFQSGPPIQISGASDGSFSTAGGGTAAARPNVVAGQPVEVPKALQHWYDGKTTVALPDGRQYTPCAFCFLKYNPDRFQGQVVTTPSGSVVLRRS